MDAKVILERNGSVRGEAQLVVTEFESPLHEVFNRLLAVTVGTVGMKIRFHLIIKYLKSITCRNIKEVVIKKDIGIMVFVVGEKEKARACIHLQGQRNVGELVLRAADSIDTKDEFATMPHITVVRFGIIIVAGEGAADVQATADEPVEAVPCGSLIHHIGVDCQYCRHITMHIVPSETIAKVELECEMIGWERLEIQTVHKTEGCSDGVVVGGSVLACLSKGSDDSSQRDD